MADVNVRIRSTEEVSKSTKNADDSLKKFKGGLNDVVKELTGFNLAQIGVAGGVVALVAGIKSAVNETMNYAKTVRQMSASLGTGAEETSRIIQMFDDFGVEAGQVQQILNMAVQRGFQPTIEGIAGLADELNKIEDPTKRAAEMQSIFGRQWATVNEVIKQGGQGIRDQAAAVADNLILTEAQVKKAREFEIAQDNLNDAFTGLKYTIGNAFIPVLSSAATGLNKIFNNAVEATKSLKDLKAEMDQAGSEALNSSGDWADYQDKMRDAAAANGYLVDSEGRLYRAVAAHRGDLNKTGKDIIDQNYMLTKTEYDQRTALIAYRDALEAQNKAKWEASEKTGDLSAHEKQLAKTYKEVNDAEKALQLSNRNEQLAVAAKATRDYDLAMLQLKQDSKLTFDEINTGIDSTIASTLKAIDFLQAGGGEIQKAYEEVYKALDSGLIKPEQAEASLRPLFVKAEALKVKMGEITADEAAENIRATLGVSLQEAYDLLKNIDGFQAHATVTTTFLQTNPEADPRRFGGNGNGTYSGPGYTPPTPPRQNPGGEGLGGANGLNFVVPPGYPNDSFGPIWASSGEQVNITPTNQFFGGVNFNIVQQPGQSSESLATVIDKRLTYYNQQDRAGARYAQ